MISVYTDGASGQKADKPGGWAWVIVRDEVEVLATNLGGSPKTTNNIMELTAAIEGLKALRELMTQGVVKPGEVPELVCDSQYTLGMASGGMSPTKNKELCEEIKSLATATKVRFRWVRGHKGNTWNERCDSLAGKAKDQQQSDK